MKKQKVAVSFFQESNIVIHVLLNHYPFNFLDLHSTKSLKHNNIYKVSSWITEELS